MKLNLKNLTRPQNRDAMQGKVWGFTLIETLVGISILLVAVVPVLVLLGNDLSYITSARDKVTALYLAEDAMDFIKYRVDTNFNSGAADWLDGFTYVCGFGNPNCQIDSFNDTVTSCSGTCPLIQIDPVSGAYGYNSGWANTKFTRTIMLQSESGIVPANTIVPGSPDPSSNAEGMSIDVIISWLDKGVPRQFTLKGYAYNWRGVLPYTVAP